MKRLVYPTLLLLFVVCMSTCVAPPPQPGDAKISPGTRFGDFRFTQAGTEAISYVTTMKCPVDQNTNARSCVLRVGTKANIGKGFLDDDLFSGKSLDEKWSELTHEMTVEGRAVDLQAFGYINNAHPGIGMLRTPNIVVAASKPGTVTVRYTGVYDGDPFDEELILTFTEFGG
jgi:hypothetical protein